MQRIYQSVKVGGFWLIDSFLNLKKIIQNNIFSAIKSGSGMSIVIFKFDNRPPTTFTLINGGI